MDTCGVSATIRGRPAAGHRALTTAIVNRTLEGLDDRGATIGDEAARDTVQRGRKVRGPA